MRVLLGISYYEPNISGLTIYAKNLAQELVKRGYEVEVITSKHVKNLPFRKKENGIEITRVWTPLIFGRGPIMPTYLLDALKSAIKADVVNCHIPQFEAVFLVLWAKLLRKKVILTHHCDLSNWPGLINQITEKVTYLSLLISGYFADRIVVYTKDYADHSKYLQNFNKKLEYILPPVKVEKPQGTLSEKFRKVGFKIGFAGRITREKGISYLINTIPKLKKEFGNNFKIFLAGPESEVVGGSHKEEISDLIEKHKKYLVFLGPLNQKQMANFYQMIDCLVLPSVERLESFGFVQVEAMLNGCPVVASDLPGVRMPVKLSGMGEAFPVKDGSTLARKMVKVLKAKEKYVKPKGKIKRVFNYKATIDKYETLFSN